jgi:hypothetical protein
MAPPAGARPAIASFDIWFLTQVIIHERMLEYMSIAFHYAKNVQHVINVTVKF